MHHPIPEGIETIKGTEPGSIFFVFAQDSQFKYAVRAFVKYDEDSTYVIHRVRVVPVVFDPDVSSVGRDIIAKFPRLTFSGMSHKHASFQGVMAIKGGVLRWSNLCEVIASHGLVGKLYEAITDALFGKTAGQTQTPILTFASMLMAGVQASALPDDKEATYKKTMPNIDPEPDPT